jgi:two-component system heavy metal sensor histidine kinase CusS
LSLLYTLSASALLIGSAGFLYWVLERNLEREGNQFLADKIHLLRLILKERWQDTELIRSEVQWEVTANRFLHHYVRLLDNRGNVLLETPDMSKSLGPDDFPPPVEAGELPPGIRKTLPSGRVFLLMSATAEFGPKAEPERIVQVGLDITTDGNLLSDYRRKLVAVLLLGILLSSAAGTVVARRGMRPLARITRAIQRISASQLHDRIASTGWPRELMALAAEFDKMLDRLEDSFQRLSQFSADLAHELRTPVNNLMGEAGVALAKTRTPEEYCQTLESSLEEYGRLARMIESLLFLARADNAKVQVQRAPMDARRAIDAVREYFEALSEEKGVRVQCEGHAQLHADAMLFRHAVSNLVSNALRHTPTGGQITIAVKKLDDQIVEVRVSDTGEGIAPEHLPKVFDRFYRVDPARSHHPDRTGLGLAIAQSILRLHGGRSAVRSKPGQGTTVTLSFPAS